MPKKLKLDLDQLKELYLIRNLTKQECADQLGVSMSTISRALRQYQILKPKALVYEKVSQNNLAKYGVKNVAQLEASQKKSKATCVKRYGVDNVAKSSKVKYKTQRTNLARYGHKSGLASIQIKKKVEATCLDKYGTKFAVASQEVQAKIQATNKKRYGGKSPFTDKAIQEKIRKTNLTRYGVTNQFQTEDFKHKAWRKYNFEGVTFDSSLELIFWIYAKDHHESIIREPVRFEYFCAGKQHYYTPDFLYNGVLIDIKGDHLVKDGKLIDVFGHLSEAELQAKQECMKVNNVHILKKADILDKINYINSTYGKQYLKQFRTKTRKGAD